MAVSSNVTYTIQGATFSMSFSGPPNMTVTELKSYLAGTASGVDLAQFTDAEWDAAVQSKRDNETGIGAVPNWATWTPQQAYDHVVADVFQGQTKAQAEAWIDANVTTLAQAKIGLKLVADAVIDLRDMMAFAAKVIIYLIKRK